MDRSGWDQRRPQPAPRVLVGGLIVAAVLMLLPARLSDAIKDLTLRLLQPAQSGMRAIREQCQGGYRRIAAIAQSAGQMAELQQQLQALQQQNQQLSDALAAAGAQDAIARADGQPPLLHVDTIEARVLGQTALGYLSRHHLLDVGEAKGVSPEALVAVGSTQRVLDRGRDGGVSEGRLALRGSAVWGRVVQAGAHVSIVRAVTDPAYRDVVRLGGAKEAPRGPQGMLEGIGGPLAKIEEIDVTQPVAVGDLVFADAERGLVTEPLLYGRVVRVERPAGASHWQIWMQPAAASDPPDRVLVLRVEIHPHGTD